MSKLSNTVRLTRTRIGATAALVGLLAATAAGCSDGGTAASGSSEMRVEFAAPADGDHIAGSIAVRMQADGVTIEPAGEVRPNAGHFHVMVDHGCLEAGTAIPKDGDHRHFGKGQTETTLSLPPGEHTLCLQVGDGVHAATTLTDEISVTVGVTDIDEWCGVAREIGVLLEGDSLDIPLEELQPVHADVAPLVEQLIDGIDVVDAEVRDDVLTMTDGQRQLSQAIVDAADETAMRAATDEVMSQAVDVGEATYEWIGTTCGLMEPESGEADAADDEPLVEAASHGDISVIVDQSPTVSDVGALGFLAARSDVELLAVTMPETGESDCAPGAVTTRTVLDAAGQTDVPIGCGGVPLDGANDWPTEWSQAADGLAGIVAPGAEQPTYADAESVLLEALHAADDPVTIVVLGPLTNIAAVLQADPSVADRIEQIVVMGGAVSVAGNVEPDLSAEWNLHAHPAAARTVIESGVPVALVPLEATDDVPLTSAYVAGVGAIDNDLAGVEAAALGTLAGVDGWFMWDELAAVLTVQPEVATWSERTIVVEDDGSTVESPDGTVVQVAEGADAASVWSIMLSALSEFGG